MNDEICKDGKPHKWGIDGMHTNEFCKKCFMSRPSDNESQADVVIMPFKALAYGARFKFRNCKDGKTWIKMFDNTICEYNKDYINHKNWLGQQIALADFDDVTEFVA